MPSESESRTGAEDFLEAMAERRAAWPLSKKVEMWLRWNVVNRIKDFPSKIKWFVQRGHRGWADSDAWSACYYLARLNIQMIERLKTNLHGFPCDLEFEPMLVAPEDAQEFLARLRDLDDQLGLENADGMQRWEALLDLFIEGWAAYVRYDETWNAADREQFEAMMPLYTLYFGGLWD